MAWGPPLVHHCHPLSEHLQMQREHWQAFLTPTNTEAPLPPRTGCEHRLLRLTGCLQKFCPFAVSQRSFQPSPTSFTKKAAPDV